MKTKLFALSLSMMLATSALGQGPGEGGGPGETSMSVCMEWTGTTDYCVWYSGGHDIPCPTDVSNCSGNDIHVSSDSWPKTKEADDPLGGHPVDEVIVHDCQVTCPCIVRSFNGISFCGPDTFHCSALKANEYYLNSDLPCDSSPPSGPGAGGLGGGF